MNLWKKWIDNQKGIGTVEIILILLVLLGLIFIFKDVYKRQRCGPSGQQAHGKRESESGLHAFVHAAGHSIHLLRFRMGRRGEKRGRK